MNVENVSLVFAFAGELLAAVLAGEYLGRLLHLGPAAAGEGKGSHFTGESPQQMLQISNF